MSVFVGDVFDDLVAPVVAEVCVEIGHTDALAIEKTLEHQMIPDGIHVSDADKISDEASGAGAASRPPPGCAGLWRSG